MSVPPSPAEQRDKDKPRERGARRDKSRGEGGAKSIGMEQSAPARGTHHPKLPSARGDDDVRACARVCGVQPHAAPCHPPQENATESATIRIRPRGAAATTTQIPPKYTSNEEENACLSLISPLLYSSIIHILAWHGMTESGPSKCHGWIGAGPVYPNFVFF